MPLASHLAHSQIYWPAQASNFLRNAISQPHTILFASIMPLASHIAHMKLYLPAHIVNFLSHVAHIQFHLPKECHWPAIWLIQNSTCQHMQPISLGIPMASHRAHTHFSLRAHVANSLRNAIGQPYSSYPILLAGICSQIPQECHWPAT